MKCMVKMFSIHSLVMLICNFLDLFYLKTKNVQKIDISELPETL